MHGGEGEERKRRQQQQQRRMLQGPGAGAVAAAAAVDSKQNSADFFVKDGRKIQVGDCALFQAGNAPPFIGIIRWINGSKEEYLKLGVNWLYRPADVKLPKGVLLEAAPNEVFYSFHRDEIPAASLLHPCKVAFLCKGVELPTGISSFVCRRVYDVANKCLWWLTDQDYVNERQEEVDQLLDRTRLEMHAAVQSGGRSPKPTTGSSSTQQLKSVSDSAQNSGTSFQPQVKVKKRERSETEPIKRERLKTEDGDSVSSKLDNMIKAELAKITEKGGLISIEAVEKLVHLIQLDRAERKLDLGGRVLLADVISATDKHELLSRFVQLRGVSVFDEWLQEAHRGKAGDGCSPKESDKSIEELLLALLRALDKLPVNLNALQACNIGKSVNQLRSHKNLEIQRKARSLVETWKKRVDAEIKLNDAKSTISCQTVSWPVKQGFTEVPHGGNKRPVPTELVMKGPITQTTTCKALPSKPGLVDAATKVTPVVSGPIKVSLPLSSTVTSSTKDTPIKAVASSGVEMPLAPAKEEKSSSPGQSQNSQSFSGDHVKAVGSSWKEDARSLPSAPMIPCKNSSSTSRHRRSSNGFAGTSAVQKETNLGKPGSLNRTTTLDKVAQAGSTFERQLDMPVVDHGNSQKLIVRLPNPGPSPSRSASGGSYEDPMTAGSRGSSPGIPDKIDQFDRRIKIKGDACRNNVSTDSHVDAWQSNDMKEGLVGVEEGMKSLAANVIEESNRKPDEIGKSVDISKTSPASLDNEKDVSLHEAKMRNAFSSINALIESCANEASALSAGDDIGMNLLASVATGEMSKADLVSPSGSPGSPPAVEDNEAKPNIECDSLVSQCHGQPLENSDIEAGKQEKNVDSMLNRESAVGHDKDIIPLQENVKEVLDGDGTDHHGDERKAPGQAKDSSTVCKTKVKSPVSDESKPADSIVEKATENGKLDVVCNTASDGCDSKDGSLTMKPEKIIAEESSSSYIKADLQKLEVVEGGAGNVFPEQQPLPIVATHLDAADRCGDVSDCSVVEKGHHSEKVDAKAENEKPTNSRGRSPLESNVSERTEQTNHASSACDDRPQCAVTSKGPEIVSDKKEDAEQGPAGSGKLEESPVTPNPDIEQSARSTDLNVSGQADHDKPASSTDASLAVNPGPDCTSKVDFDLNEGFLGDESHQIEPVTMPAPVCSSAIHFPSLSQFPSPSVPNGSPAPITVAAPAKGPFVPPENLLKSKAEPGWKGSAATSAFRPAEPRKVLEMPLSTSDAPSSSNNNGKQGRPALDFDLNVPDERVLEDMASQSSAQTTGSESGAVNNRDAPIRVAGGFDLDLNRADESTENGLFVANTCQRLEVPLMPVRPTQSGVPNGDANSLRDFDLNGPGIDESNAEPGSRNQHVKNGTVPLLPPIAGLRVNNTDLGTVSAWFPPGNSFPAVAIPSFLHDRGEHTYPVVTDVGSQRIAGSSTGSSTFGADIYRHQVLSSSPSIAFSHTTSFPYPGFPFGSSFPVASSSFSGGPSTYVSSSGAVPCFPPIPSQIMGPAGPVSSLYPRPYMISYPESSISGGPESSRKWARPGLDLNAGPGSADVETRDERLSSAPRQLALPTTQALVEEQGRIYQVAGGLKRKEPEGGWDAERIAYKQPSWQ